eukprot:TRINITY_DN8208_c0_g1_i1.p1 TRINITY_DN8208_c0_g1~~TRINITY_DN8208_c0_g1_i1.p1  ORF type:complete len:705 (+),score=-4.14 TRINITY_DN8208_c0_g1_i1:123-2237(+)
MLMFRRLTTLLGLVGAASALRYDRVACKICDKDRGASGVTVLTEITLKNCQIKCDVDEPCTVVMYDERASQCTTFVRCPHTTWSSSPGCVQDIYVNPRAPRTPRPPTPPPPTPPPTPVPSTPLPPTSVPRTPSPPTPSPPTPSPPTPSPPTPSPPTLAPLTAVPRTPAPPTPVPQTQAPSTAVPATISPPTMVPVSPPSTGMPGIMSVPTGMPATLPPSTGMPAAMPIPTAMPATLAAPTLTPNTPVPLSPAPASPPTASPSESPSPTATTATPVPPEITSSPAASPAPRDTSEPRVTNVPGVTDSPPETNAPGVPAFPTAVPATSTPGVTKAPDSASLPGATHVPGLTGTPGAPDATKMPVSGSTTVPGLTSTPSGAPTAVPQGSAFPAPLILPGTREHVGSVFVRIVTDVSGGDVYYTLDGTAPSHASFRYLGGFRLQQGSHVVRAAVLVTSGSVGSSASATQEYVVGAVELRGAPDNDDDIPLWTWILLGVLLACLILACLALAFRRKSKEKEQRAAERAALMQWEPGHSPTVPETEAYALNDMPPPPPPAENAVIAAAPHGVSPQAGFTPIQAQSLRDMLEDVIDKRAASLMWSDRASQSAAGLHAYAPPEQPYTPVHDPPGVYPPAYAALAYPPSTTRSANASAGPAALQSPVPNRAPSSAASGGGVVIRSLPETVAAARTSSGSITNTALIQELYHCI